MKLREFVSKFVCRDSLIRLWKQNEDGSYEFLYKDDERKHGMPINNCIFKTNNFTIVKITLPYFII